MVYSYSVTELYIRAKQCVNEEQDDLISLKNGVVVARDCNLRNVLTRKKARQLPKQVQSGNLESRDRTLSSVQARVYTSIGQVPIGAYS